MIEMFAHGNLSLNLATNPHFITFVHAIMPEFAVPGDAEIRRLIVARVDEIRGSYQPGTEGRFVTLMVDGVRRVGRCWVGVSIATTKAFPFWRLESLENQTADAIGSAIARVVGTLQNRGFIVCAVVTDNASNEKASLDPESSKSAQQRANVPLFRIPCLSHTASPPVSLR
jgi:hypothetical protein